MDRRRSRRAACSQCPGPREHHHFPCIVPAHTCPHRSPWLPRHFHRHLRTPKSRIRPHLLQSSFRKHNSRRTMSQRSEEHTSELQSRLHLVCRLLLEKKKKI